MSLTVGELNAKLSLDKDSFDRGLDTSHSRFKGFAGKITKIATVAGIGIGVALGAAAIKGVASFASMEKGMNEVFTLLPGISQDAMDDMTGQVKDFSREFGVLPDEVIPALYQSISAGVPKDNVFEFLEVAQKAAKGGVTDLTTAVDGISSVVNAYGEDVIGATEASDLMFTAVRLGKTNFGEMSNSLFQVIPTASSLGVGFGDVTAALASMTAQGTPTSVATTQIRAALVEMSKAGSKTADVFEKAAGVSFREFIAQGGNLEGALGIMSDAAGDMDVSVSDLFGSVEAGSAVLALTSESGAAAYSDALTEMDDSAGATEAANDQMSQGLTDSFNKIKAAVAVGVAEFGEKLAPTIQYVVDWVIANWPKIQQTIGEVMANIRAAVEPILEWLIEFWTENGEAIIAWVLESWTSIQETISEAMEIIRAIVEPILEWLLEFWQENGTEIMEFAAEIWTSIQEIIDSAMEMIRALVERIMIIVTAIWETHGDKIMKLVDKVWPHIRDSIRNVLAVIKGIFDAFAALFRGDWEGLWEALKSILLALWDQIKGVLDFSLEALLLVFTLALDGLVVAWEFAWEKIKGFLSGIWDGIKNIVRSNLNTVIGWVEGFVNGLIRGINSASGLLSKLPGVDIAQVAEMHIPRLHRGGTVEGIPGEEVLTILKAGETVTDSGQSVLPGGSLGDGGIGGGTQINVTTPTREAREIAREIAFVTEYEMKVATG